MHVKWFFWITYSKLLNFFKLMDSEDSVDISSMSTSFFSKAWWVSSKSLWEISFLHPFTSIVTRNRLFGSSNKIKFFMFNLFTIFIFFNVTSNFIQLIIKIRKLACLCHCFSVHIERTIHWSETLGCQETETKLLKSKV